ncbi:RHS repeat domain-containing protein [Riemerella anatipestifer]|uniref:RHS repeat domain-containing protein n=1 Tax=Riemerella anatipestifer TaxID=34085 RepID=UPI003DA8CB4A
MYCQTVIKTKSAFRGFVGPTTETRRSDDGAVRNKKRLPKWQKGKFTKHYFEGTSRIVSKLGEGTFHQPTGLTAGGIDYIKQSAKVQEAIDSYIRGLNVPPGPPTQHGIYGTPDFTGQEYPSIDWSDISQDQEPPEGWPRPPKFNEPGDVPGPPVQYGDPVKPDNVKGGFGYVDNGIEEKNLYFYHPDHLGSSSYITDKDGNINQHTEYMAFGEVLFDEHKVSRRMPYLFNGKELDSETGLYYYGARYYDPRVSIFLNVDPLAEKAPNWTPYRYGFNNPIKYTDPTGLFETKFGAWWHRLWNGGGHSSSIKYNEKNKEYYYNRLNNSTGNEINFSAVYGGKSKISIKNTAGYEFKGSVELGLLKVRDKGTTGYEIKGPTITLGELSIGKSTSGDKFLKAYNPFYELGMGRRLKGGLGGVKLETKYGDFKAFRRWELPTVWFHIDHNEINNVASYMEYKDEVGIGKPWLEFKVERSNRGIILRCGIQEDWGISINNVLGIKGEFRYQGITEISY